MKKDLFKGKLTHRFTYRKGTVFTNPNELIEVIKKGAQVEILAQEIRDLNGEKVEVVECRIYFINSTTTQ